MTARCPKCSRLLCDHPVPRSYASPVDDRQLSLGIDLGRGESTTVVVERDAQGRVVGHRVRFGGARTDVSHGAGGRQASNLEERRHG